MKTNNKKENRNGGFFTPTIPMFIVALLIALSGIVYALVQHFG